MAASHLDATPRPPPIQSFFPDRPRDRREAPRPWSLFAVAVAAPIIGLAIGVLMARPVARPLPILRPRVGQIDPALVLRGASTGIANLATGVAAPFVLPARTAEDRSRATRCLADAVYYEAAREPIEGRRAVAQVVLNRVRDPNFPKSVCGVVYDGWKSGPACQFSFACDGSLARAPLPGLYREALDVAEQALAGRVEPRAGLATHYHATAVDPWWRADLVRIAQIGSQIFYRWPGEAGLPAAFTGRYAGGEQVPSTLELIARSKLKAEPGVQPPLATIAAASSNVMGADQVTYLYGRRVRTRAEIQQVNRWLEEKRPLTEPGAER